MFSGGCLNDRNICLQIYSVKQNRVLLSIPVQYNDVFTLDYIHSSEKTPICDYFTVTGAGTLLLTEEQFDWYAVGLEAHAGYTDSEIRFDGRKTRVLLNREFDPFPLRVGWVARQVMTIRGQSIALKELADPGDLLYISIVEP